MDIAIDKVREMLQFAAYPAGTSMIYHTGFIVKDRERGRKYGEVKRRAEAAHAVAKMALELSEAGKAYLTQRRIGPEVYEYIATRSGKAK